MSSDLAGLVKRVSDIVSDPDFDMSNVPELLNDAMHEIASGIQRPDSSILTLPLPWLYTIGTVTTLTTTHKVVLPTNYQRDLVFARDSNGNELTIHDAFQEFLQCYPALDESGDVNAIAVKGNYLYYQPIPTVASTITIHYYRQPTDMEDATDVPELPRQYRNLLVYHVVKELYSRFDDGLGGSTAAVEKWTAKFFDLLMTMEASFPADSGVHIL